MKISCPTLCVGEFHSVVGLVILSIGNGDEKTKWALFQPTRTKSDKKKRFFVGSTTVVVKSGHCVEEVS